MEVGTVAENGMRFALIPAYEPEPILLELIQSAAWAGFRVIVVDDGSGEAYTDLFRQAAASATVLTHRENLGKGCAIKTGLQFIRNSEAGDYTVVTLDADGQHCITDALLVCEAAKRRPGTLVLGSRKLQGNVPLRSRFGNTVTRLIFGLTAGRPIHDTQTGLRAFHASLVPALLAIPGDRYEYEMNVLLSLARTNTPMEEIPIATIYTDNNAGSHFHTLKDSLRIYKEILRFSLSSLASFLVDYGLYSMLTLLTGNLMVSNLCARVVSASINYTLNRKLVFQSNAHVGKSALQYFLLAATILAGNTLVLHMLVNAASLNPYAAKVLTEVVFFLLSWLAQRFVVFRRQGIAEGKPLTVPSSHEGGANQ